MEQFIKIKINEQKYLFQHTTSFKELKFSILEETGLLVDKFCFEDNFISEKINTEAFAEKIILCQITNKHQYEKHGQNNDSFRCKSCKSNLSKITLKCKHTNKCKMKLFRQDKIGNDSFYISNNKIQSASISGTESQVNSS